MFKVIVVVILALLLVGCGTSENATQTAIAETESAMPTATPDPCDREIIESYLNELDGLLPEFQAGVELAENTTLADLPGPVADLQTVRGKVDEIEMPQCSFIRQMSVDFGCYMDAEIGRFLSLINEDDDYDWQVNMAKGCFEKYSEASSSILVDLASTPAP